jgi:hypothetical protein
MRKLILITLGMAALAAMRRKGRGFGPFSEATVAAVLDDVAVHLRGKSENPSPSKKKFWFRITCKSKMID